VSGDGRGGWSRGRWTGDGRGGVQNVRHLAYRNT